MIVFLQVTEKVSALIVLSLNVERLNSSRPYIAKAFVK